jgi:RNA polymerase sigma factor (sigma-70 family)
MARPSKSCEATSAQFATTLWTQVLNAQNDQVALGNLCERYWYPLYAFFRREGRSPEDARDLVQGFFAHLLDPQHARLASVGKEKGRFRSFLLGSAKRFATDLWRREAALKRGGGLPTVSIDHQKAEACYAFEPVDTLNAEKIYERRWAMTILERVLVRLEDEFKAAGKEKRFCLLQGHLLGENDASAYSELGSRLGISANAVAAEVHRLRAKYRENFRAEVMQTVGSQQDFDEELRHIFAILSD